RLGDNESLLASPVDLNRLWCDAGLPQAIQLAERESLGRIVGGDEDRASPQSRDRGHAQPAAKLENALAAENTRALGDRHRKRHTTGPYLGPIRQILLWIAFRNVEEPVKFSWPRD